MSSDIVIILKVSSTNDLEISEEIRAFAKGPNKIANRYKGLLINSYIFHIKERDEDKKTQNFGVVILFKCDWANTSSAGIKQNEFDYTLVNFSRLIHTGQKIQDDPFVFF
ncbi:hypothetical protein M5K25_024522 [Dendrobium thyrsiflorum]|uniref:DUF4216 domain-containing protein n=1 Tax=Dendrobium thyrsiflorum TaxID=117978 RepID=A0ABD0U248_DENTH